MFWHKNPSPPSSPVAAAPTAPAQTLCNGHVWFAASVSNSGALPFEPVDEAILWDDITYIENFDVVSAAQLKRAREAALGSTAVLLRCVNCGEVTTRVVAGQHSLEAIKALDPYAATDCIKDVGSPMSGPA